MSSEREAHTSVEELFKTLIATGGIMLTLLWGLTQRDLAAGTVVVIRYASVVLVLSTAASLIGLQFVVTEIEKKTAHIATVRSVAWSFIAAWLAFLAGSVLVVIAIFGIG